MECWERARALLIPSVLEGSWGAAAALGRLGEKGRGGIRTPTPGKSQQRLEREKLWALHKQHTPLLWLPQSRGWDTVVPMHRRDGAPLLEVLELSSPRIKGPTVLPSFAAPLTTIHFYFTSKLYVWCLKSDCTRGNSKAHVSPSHRLRAPQQDNLQT